MVANLQQELSETVRRVGDRRLGFGDDALGERPLVTACHFLERLTSEKPQG